MAAVRNQPAYARIRDEIALAISRGVMMENVQLPTERGLCDQYGVSRITIRHALALLEQDGLIRKRQGQGIFVCPLRYDQSIDHMYDFADELRRQNVVPSWKVLSMDRRTVNGDVAARLGLYERAQCCRIELISYADAKPYAYEVVHIPAALMGKTTAKEIEKHGVAAALWRASQVKADRAEESFEAMLAPVEAVNAFGRKAPLGVMKIVRVTFDGNHPLEYTTRYVLGDKIRFRSNFDG